MAGVILTRGVPEHIRSERCGDCRQGGSQLACGAKALYVEPSSLWENGYCESFNGKLRDECLDQEIFSRV